MYSVVYVGVSLCVILQTSEVSLRRPPLASATSTRCSNRGSLRHLPSTSIILSQRYLHSCRLWDCLWPGPFDGLYGIGFRWCSTCTCTQVGRYRIFPNEPLMGTCSSCTKIGGGNVSGGCAWIVYVFPCKLPSHIHSYLPWPTESTCIVALLVLCFLAQWG